MTVSTTSPRMPLYTGNGVTAAYPYTFRVFAATDIVVKVQSGGVETTKTYLTDYAVSGVGSYSGGNVTFVTTPAAGDIIAISRSVPLTQTTDLQNQGPYYAQTIEDMSDRSTMEAQQIQAQLDRTLQIRETDYGTVSTALPVPSASSLLGWNSTATGITNITTLTGLSVLGNPIVDAYTAGVNFTAGSTTALTLSQAPGSKNQTVVTFNGLVQHKSSYSTSGLTLTFSSPIPVGVTQVEVAQVTTLAIPLVTPVAGSITASMLASAAVTASAIAAGSVGQVALASDVLYVVDSIAALKALTAGAHTAVLVRGYLTPGDGGGGLFRWVAGDVTADNGGTCIQPTVGAGRYFRESVIYVRQFGATGGGITDDTAAIQSAVTAAGNDSLVVFDRGTYKVTSTILQPYSRQRWVGAGRRSTTLVFAPTATDTMVQVGNSGGINTSSSIVGMSFSSSDGTFTKTAIELQDTSDFQLDVEITGTVVASGTQYWSGGSGSVGIQLKGREATRIERCFISADKPIVISDNVAVTVPQVDCDFLSIRDPYLIANGYPCITIDTGVEITHFLCDGAAFVRGTNAIKMVDTTSTRVVTGFVVRASSWEQGTDVTAYAYDLQFNQNHYGVQIQSEIGPLTKGVRLRKCINVELAVICNQATALEVLNVDATVQHMNFIGCYWGTTTTATMTNQRQILGLNKTSSSEPLPRNASYDIDTNTAYDLHHDGAVGGKQVSLADSAVQYLAAGGAVGYLDVIRGDGATATFRLKGTFLSVQEINDPDGIFSPTAGTAASGNCYYDGAGPSGAGFYFQNKFGSTFSFRFILRGASVNF